jgi:OmpA-OmpF porin, OOP family
VKHSITTEQVGLMKLKIIHSLRTLAVLLSGALLLQATQAAITLPKDVPGGADPLGLKRFAGATLIGHKADSWEAGVFPISPAIVRGGEAGYAFKDTMTVEGVRTRAVYLAPAGKSPLEVYRNHEQALQAAGFKKKLFCEGACMGGADAAIALKNLLEPGLVWSEGYIPNKSGGSYAVSDVMTYADARLLVGVLPQAGAEKWVLVFVSRAVNDATNHAQVTIQTVEPKAMPSGQVSVLKASEIQDGLRSDGKVAFYGLYFDTGKADIKPNSRPQLEEMGKLLKAQSGLQVYVVGHTDGQGQLDANLTLSQQRAQAVVDALVKTQGIDGKRLVAKGVASLAPLASNAGEDGRARNRRVELVVR